MIIISNIYSDSESKRLGYDPDGFGKAASKLKVSPSGYESQNPYQLTQQVLTKFICIFGQNEEVIIRIY